MVLSSDFCVELKIFFSGISVLFLFSFSFSIILSLYLLYIVFIKLLTSTTSKETGSVTFSRLDLGVFETSSLDVLESELEIVLAILSLVLLSIFVTSLLLVMGSFEVNTCPLISGHTSSTVEGILISGAVLALVSSFSMIFLVMLTNLF
uniref:Uncharacterized protein n=1 Tax=Cacopsylla melanoneura TaxID=428564 RepID=A0A8D8UV90_9HEMI